MIELKRIVFKCLLIIAALVVFDNTTKAADRLRICVALLIDSPTVLITEPFANAAARDVLEEQFSNWLIRNHFAVKNVQCQLPVSPEEAQVRVRTAIEFNKKIGFIPQMIAFR